jgi:aerobic-type carbon monoxide dehydrogenase small subunit (CoxS/CutS family)
VLLDDKPVFSCLVPVAALRERKVRTLEGCATASRPLPRPSRPSRRRSAATASPA